MYLGVNPSIGFKWTGSNCPWSFCFYLQENRMLSAHQVTKSYGIETVLAQITFSNSPGERLGLKTARLRAGRALMELYY